MAKSRSRSRSKSRSKSRSQSRVVALAPKVRSNKIYCGSDVLSKKRRFGTAEECAKVNQIRLWGIRKVDSKVLKKYSKSNKDKRSKSEMQAIAAGLKGKVNAAKRARDDAKDAEERKVLQAKYVAAVEKFNEAVMVLKSMK